MTQTFEWFGARMTAAVLWPLGAGLAFVAGFGAARRHFALVQRRERTEWEEKLRQSELLLREAGALAHFGGWHVDLETMTPLWTDEIYRIHEVEPVGRPLSLEEAIQFYLPESREVIRQAVERSIREGTPYDLELQIRTARENVRWVRAIGKPEFEGKRCVALRGCFQDITESRQAAETQDRLYKQLQQSQKLEALGTLAGGIAHDFNNILGSVAGFTELARLHRHEPERVESHTTAVLAACERAKQIVRQILAFGKRDDQAKRRPIALGNVVAESCRLVRAGLPLEVEIELLQGDQGSFVYANDAQIHQVVMNLVTNAAQSFDPSTHARCSISLEVQVRSLATTLRVGSTDIPPGEYVELCVADNGRGIDEALHHRIFEPFFTTKRTGQGSGLGLSVVHGILRELGAFIGFMSEPGRGTTFRVFIPKSRAESREFLPVPREPRSGAGFHILLVDDERLLGNSVQLYLRSCGYTVDFCESPGDALARVVARQAEYALVLTDYAMPGMNGVEFARAIRSRGFAMPIVLATGYLGEVDSKLLVSLGIRQVLEKPVRFSALREAIEAALIETDRAAA